MNPVVPTLYVKTGCPWCEEVLEFLEARKIPFSKVVVSGDREALQDMIDLSGQSKAPTMDWNGEVLADFGVDELIPFLRSKGVAVDAA
jgi:glutaredoxin